MRPPPTPPPPLPAPTKPTTITPPPLMIGQKKKRALIEANILTQLLYALVRHSVPAVRMDAAETGKEPFH
jgi:hypothetical protein